jgi:Transposase, Mutator family
MTATLNEVAAKKKQAEQSAEQRAAAELVRRAREQGLSLTGPDGLLKQLTKTVLETALNEEMTEHLGYEKHDPPGAGTGNIRNGTRAKTVLTEASGQVEIEVPRDRAGTFSPQIVKKRQRRLSGVDEIVLSLYAKGLTTGEISAHFAEIYGASVSKETISRITDKVVEEMTDWAVRPLDAGRIPVVVANPGWKDSRCRIGHGTRRRRRRSVGSSSCSGRELVVKRLRWRSECRRAVGRCGSSTLAAWSSSTPRSAAAI